MSRATPRMRDFAKRLIAYEAAQKKSAGAGTGLGFDVFDQLRPHLATLMGGAGFRALLGRGLALGKEEVFWLGAVQVNADGSMGVLGEQAERLSPGEWAEGRIVLLAQVLGLLVAFIGEDLTLRLVRDAWPKVSLDNLDGDKGGKNEKT